MNTETHTSRVVRVRHELRRRTLHIVAIDTLSPHVRAITFGGEALQGFVSASFDDHVKLILNADSDTPVMRDYTPRAYDAQAQRLAIEFALHGEGPAAQWAANALRDLHEPQEHAQEPACQRTGKRSPAFASTAPKSEP